MPSWRRVEAAKFAGSLPKSVAITLADAVYIRREGLPQSLVAQFTRLAVFQNPAF